MPSEIGHVPVLVRESLELLALERGGLFVDATLGLGGHSEAILEASPEARVLGIDRDAEALARATARLARFGGRFEGVHAQFDELAEVMADRGLAAGILADLGVSSLQLDSPERGFSFRFDGPLDMRMGLSELTAADLVNRSAEEELVRIFRDYGEEWQARRIARAVVAVRRGKPFETTGELRETIVKAKGSSAGDREGRVDPATRVFQALRIAVNRELAGLESFLDQTVNLLQTDGRLVVISYHSLEDRIVKNSVRDLSRGEVDPVTGRPQAESILIATLTRKPIRPSDEEIRVNPRSRSARLRAARRL